MTGESIEIECRISVPKTITRQLHVAYHTIIPIPTLIIGIPVERVPRHKAVGGEVGGELGVDGYFSYQ